ncbi:MAG: mechanosensitive ion channel family protein [Actinobacteria bacterium]|nr:mechanosensitive ion channel family protein [Actinomycetota bacterium]
MDGETLCSRTRTIPAASSRASWSAAARARASSTRSARRARNQATATYGSDARHACRGWCRSPARRGGIATLSDVATTLGPNPAGVFAVDFQSIADRTPRQVVVIPLILLAAWVVNLVLRWLIRRIGLRMIASADRLGDFVPDEVRSGGSSNRLQARSETVTAIARSMASFVVVVVAAALVLAELGASLPAILASAGVVGVALGFGAQTLVRDVLAGFFIVVEDRYGVGDIVDCGQPVTGVVERVTLRSTRVRDVNGTVWHIANGEVLSVGNKSQSWSRAVVDVVVAPETDVERAVAVLAEVGAHLRADESWDDRITGDVEVLGVVLIDPTGITLRAMCDTQPAEQFLVEREFRFRVLQAFDAAGIRLAQVIVPGPVSR